MFDTRSPKQHADAKESLARWWTTAGDTGLTPKGLAKCFGRRQPSEITDEFVARLFAHLAGPDGLTATSSTFTRTEVLAAIVDYHGPVWGSDKPQLSVLPPDVVEDLADRFLAGDLVMELAGHQYRGRNQIRRRDGRTIKARDRTDDEFTTTEMLLLQDRTRRGYFERRAEARAIVPDLILDRVLEDLGQLSGEQAALVRALCTSGQGVQFAVGRAGTGKTHSMRTARLAWEAAGYQILGAAVKSDAALHLQDATGIRSTPSPATAGRRSSSASTPSTRAPSSSSAKSAPSATAISTPSCVSPPKLAPPSASHNSPALDHAYAVTSHAVQGRDYDESTSRIDPHTTQAELYVDITRGRYANHVYVGPEPDLLDGEHLPTPPPDPAVTRVEQRLRRSRLEKPAIALDPDAVAVLAARGDVSLAEIHKARTAATPEQLEILRRAEINRARQIARLARRSPPTDLLAHMPTRPTIPHLRRKWDNAVVAVAVYRERWQPRPDYNTQYGWALGAEAQSPNQHAERDRVLKTVAAAITGIAGAAHEPAKPAAPEWPEVRLPAISAAREESGRGLT